MLTRFSTEDQKQASRAIEIETLKAQSHTATLQKETAEKSEMQSQIAHLSQHRDTLLTTRSALSGELSQFQSTLAARRIAQTQHAKYLSSQSRHNVPELQFWEDHLCMSISGCGQEDRLKFVFTHVCERDWEREAWFELDTSSREYKVLKSVPKLEDSEVESEVEKLNESRELGPFFKGMRGIFVKALK
jgi:kinetochore protein Spc25